MEKRESKGSLLSQWKNRDKNAINAGPIIEKAPEDAIIPLSSNQQRIWFLQQLYSENPFYNYSEALVFKGGLNVEVLLESVHKIIEKHLILRSYCDVSSNGPSIRISTAEVPIEQYDLTHLSHERACKEMNLRMEGQARKGFDLAEPPLIRISFFRQSDDTYTLFFTMHHIIIDEWSVGLLKGDLANSYQKLMQGEPIEEKTSADLNYLDYAHWQKKLDVDEEQLLYWKNKLAGDLPPLNLQLDRRRPVRPSFTGKQAKLPLSADLTLKIKTLCKQLGVTPFNFFLTAYNILLFRYTGQQDILIGTPVSNRNIKGLENVIGFFVDTVVLRNQFEGEISFNHLIQKVKENTLEAFSNKNVPFDVLVKELKVERSLSVNPFFQVMFLYHPEEQLPSFGENLKLLDDSEFDTGVAKFDLTLSVAEKKESLTLMFEYDTELFVSETINRMLAHYKNLLESIVNDIQAPIESLTMLTGEEITFFTNGQSAEIDLFARNNSVHRVIENVCETKPNTIAVSFNDTSITYLELNRKAEVLAAGLRYKLKGRKEIVGLCLDRSIEMIVGLLGILKAGCAYLPIDPNYPLVRLEFVLKDADCNLVVTHSSLNEKLTDGAREFLLIDKLKDDVPGGSTYEYEVDRSDLAYVIYTSGSSGQPKGVPVTHGNILSSTAGRLSFYEENPEAFLLMSSISFDSSKAGIFWTLCTGGHLVLTPDRIEQDMEAMASLIEDQQITHTLMLPSIYKLLLSHGMISKLQGLRTVMVAGESCPQDLCLSHFDKLPKTKLYNEYGPTEATVWCTAHQIQKSDAVLSIPIGKPTANSELFLLDKNLKMVPWGAIGEIYVSGPGLTRGYINRPKLTSHAFKQVDIPHSGSVRMYKTGDLGRYRQDGVIEFFGRSDQQIKLRGYRIELDEIENVLLKIKGISGAIAQVEEVDENTYQPSLSSFKDSTDFWKELQDNLSVDEIEELLGTLGKLK
ncbi:MAG: hypothetical protein CML04_11620 [Pseudozobellia sp.]|nr:hypothetical protein [Pseudozobellia sp.]MBG50351.1 hypothetical protein [Pseudozobellia sp.]